MRGRKENEEKMDKKIKDTLKKCPEYMTRYYYSLSNKSYTTKYRYINYVLDFLDFLNKKCELDTNDLNCFKSVSAGTIDYYMSSLGDVSDSFKRCRFFGVKSFFLFLTRNKLIDENPCDDVEAPVDRKERKVTALNKDEIKVVRDSILNGSGSKLAKKRQEKWITRDYAIIMMAISLGLRVTSISEINVDDIDFKRKEIIVTEKNNKTRTIEFGDNLLEILNSWIEQREILLKEKTKDSNALFISNQMNRITTKAIEAIVKKYTNGVDKHISPHKLRATCATMLYGATKDFELTKNMLGHASPCTTERYVEAEEEHSNPASIIEDIVF